MSSLLWLLLVAACVLVVYAAFVTALIVAGRWQGARGVARFIRDCIVLVRRLLGDPRVSRRHKLLLGALIGYLALPFDLVPDFIPVAGHIDDALVVALTLRAVLRGSGTELLREHWPGPESSHCAAVAPSYCGSTGLDRRARLRLCCASSARPIAHAPRTSHKAARHRPRNVSPT
jgi:uncharacterized membrane protein YkvA (DUF1232 family)